MPKLFILTTFFVISFSLAFSSAFAGTCSQIVLDNMRLKGKAEFETDLAIFSEVEEFNSNLPSALSWACFESIQPSSSLFSFSSTSMNSSLGDVTTSVGQYLNGPNNPLGTTCTDTRAGLATNYGLQKNELVKFVASVPHVIPSIQLFPLLTSSFPVIKPAESGTACSGNGVETGISGFRFCTNPGCYFDGSACKAVSQPAS